MSTEASVKVSKFARPMNLPQRAGSEASTYLHDRAIKAAQEIARITGARVPAPQAAAAPQKTLVERLFDAKAACKVATRQLTMHFPSDWHPKFFKQIDALLDVDDWDETDEPVTQDSFFTLIRLLVKLRDKKRPGLGVANSGHIVAAWTAGAKDRLTVECLPKDRVRWIVTVPIDDGYESAAGETSLDRLLIVLAPYSPSRWLDDEKMAEPIT